MKKILKITMLSAVLLNCATTMFAQNDTCDYAKPPATTVVPHFKLSSFVLPDFRRRALTTNFGLSNNLNSRHSYSSRQESYSHRDDEKFEDDRKSFDNRFSMNANVAFSDIHYTRKHQKETYISSDIRFNTDYTKRNDNADPTKIRSLLNLDFPNARFTQVNRRYLNENLFLGYSPDVRYNFVARREVNNTKDVEKKRESRISQNFSVEIPLEIGYGRIEPVGDARDAIYIFDALARRGVTSASKTSDEILRFAQFIAGLRNKRYLDARHRRIYETEALDSFLSTNGHRDTFSIAYITTLNDFFWFYGTNRSSGTRWSLYAAPGYEFTPIKYKDHLDGDVTRDIYENDNVIRTRFGINFTYEKPINLYWQNSFSSSLEYRQRNIRRVYKDNLSDEKKQIEYIFEPQGIHYSINQRISYFPTTRTSAYAGYGLTYSFVSRTTSRTNSGENWWGGDYPTTWVQTIKDERKEHNLGANIGAGASYFFSPQLRLNFETSLRYQYYDYYSARYSHTFHSHWDDSYYHTKYKSRPSNFSFYFGLSVNYIYY
jgi:hypothetical protein